MWPLCYRTHENKGERAWAKPVSPSVLSSQNKMSWIIVEFQYLRKKILLKPNKDLRLVAIVHWFLPQLMAFPIFNCGKTIKMSTLLTLLRHTGTTVTLIFAS